MGLLQGEVFIFLCFWDKERWIVVAHAGNATPARHRGTGRNLFVQEVSAIRKGKTRVLPQIRQGIESINSAIFQVFRLAFVACVLTGYESEPVLGEELKSGILCQIWI